MSARVYAGIVVVVVGVLLIMYSAYNINELLFIQGKTSTSDIPLYGNAVAIPILSGILLAIDGLIICGLSRKSSLALHFLANVVWIFASLRLVSALEEQVTSRLTFYRIFVFFMIAVALFALGAIVNFLPKSQTQR